MVDNTKGGGLMLPVSLIKAIDSVKVGKISRSAILWGLVRSGLESLPNEGYPPLNQFTPIEKLRDVAIKTAETYDYASLDGLKGFSVSQSPADRALVFSVGLELLDLGDNPSYSLRIRKLISLGLDRLLRTE